MSKNILYLTQTSMYDKFSGAFLPMADGNINMLRNTINEWHKYNKDNFFILLPNTLEFKNFEKLNINATPIYYDGYTISARNNRFNFPLSEIITILNTRLKDINIDIVISDVIELSTNIKQMFNINFNYIPKIISNIRHLDDEVNNTYFYRVIDGIVNSDLVTILSDSMRYELYKQLEDVLNYNMAKELEEKILTFEPSISYEELEKYKSNDIRKDLNKVIITFPGRLSIGEEKRTNWDKFIKAINILRSKMQNFEIYLTDPNNSLSMGIKRSDVFGNWIHTIPRHREAFLYLLNKTDIVVSLMDGEGFGGISIREALLFNCRPVIPYAHEYKKMASNKYYKGYVKSPIEIDDLIESLEFAISRGNKDNNNYWSEKGKYFTIENQFKNIKDKVEELRHG